MTKHNPETICVIFAAKRTADDEAGYAAAADQMEKLASTQPGYLGIDSVRGKGGNGITISYWIDEPAAIAWRDHPEHAVIRESGRDKWYSCYSLHVASIIRSYDWTKAL